MAEPTDINKNKSTAGAMVDALRVELKELQSFDTVDPEVLGGKAGKPIPVPKKFTADQIVSFMKQFPKMFPLANENAYFGIARALTVESPDLFDIPSFEEYEKKYGDVMEMQEKGGFASKNITTAKESKPANDPMPASKTTTGPSMADIADKIKNQTLTIGEAIEMGPEDKRSAVRKAIEKAGKSLDDSWFTIGENEFLIKLNEVGSESNFTTLATVQSAVEQQAAINDLSPPPNVFKAGGKARKLELEKASQGRGTKAFKQVPGAQQSLPILTEGIANIKNPDIRAAVAFNALVPLRPGEVATIRVEDIDFESGRFTEEFRSGNKIRNALDLPEVSLEILRDAAEKAKSEGREYLFLPKGTNTDLTSKEVKKVRNSFVNKMTAAVKAPGGIAERFKSFEGILGRKIEGVKDIRKIIPSIIASELGYASEASIILGHDNFDDTIDGLKGITSKHYVSQVMTEEGTTAKQALRALQNMYGEVLGLSTLNELPAAMNVNAAGLTTKDAPKLAVIPRGKDIVGTQVQGTLTDADLDLIEDVRAARSQELKLAATEAEKKRLELESQMGELDEAAIRAKEQRRMREQEIRAEERAKVKAQTTTDLTNIKSPDDFSDALKEKLRKLNFKPLMKAVPVVGAVPVYMESREAGAGPLEATGRAVLEEATLGIPEALPVAEQAVKAAAEPVAEEIKRQVPEEGFVSGLTRAMTGQGMSGFINR
jgi:hypothetical protein